MPEALRKRLRLTPEDALPTTEFELNSATDAMSAFEQICLAIPASGALIAVRNATSLHCVGSLGDAPEVGSHLPPDFGMALECIESGSVVFRDLTDDAQRVLNVGLTMEGVSQVRSAVALPMRTGGAIIGLIAVFSQRESAIQPRDIESLARIANFWGPQMADEWFPDGIPTEIARDVPVAEDAAAAESFSATIAEFPRPAEDAPAIVEAPVVEALPIDEHPSTANERVEDLEEVAAAEKAEVATPPNEVESSVPLGIASSSSASPVIDSESLFAAATTPQQEPARAEVSEAPILTDNPKPPEADLSVEALTIARAANKPASPIFLAPAEAIPAEAFHSGEPHRLTWLVVLAVFLVVLLPFWLLRSHWRRSNAALRNSASASNTAPINTTAPSAAVAAALPAPAASTKQPVATTAAKSSSSSPALAPDEEMPKPLPDLNTPPPATNPTRAAATAPKPTLPAIIKRILKSPNSVSTKSNSNLPAPTAPDITANLQPSAAPQPDPTSTENSAPSNNSAAPPEPAQPLNPAGLQPPNFTLAQSLKDHTSWVSSLAFSPAGELASASWDRTVEFLNLATGRQVRAATDKLKQVQAIAFSRDGKILAAEDASYTVAIFDPATGARLRELPTDKAVPSVGISWVYSIAFSPDGRWLAAAVDDKTVRIWDVATGTKIRDLTGPRRPVVYIAFSPNGELVATGNDEKSIQLWNVASGAPTTTLTGHKKVVNAVAFSPDGKILASASADKTIRIWDAATGNHLRTLSGHQAAVSSISFSADGRWLASGSWDKTVRIWNVATGKEIQTLRPDARAIYSVTFDPRSRWLAAGSEDGAIEIWQWNSAAGNSNPASADSKQTP